jgi:hypothetical protein
MVDLLGQKPIWYSPNWCSTIAFDFIIIPKKFYRLHLAGL